MKALPEAVQRYIAETPICRVASVLPDGTAHVAPVCPVSVEGTLYIDVSHTGGTARALAAGDKVTVLFDEYHDEWDRLKGVLLYCRAAEVTGAHRDRVWRVLREKYPQSVDAKWNPRLTLALRVEDWKQWGVVP